MFTDKVKIEGTFLDDLSPEELAALVKGLKEAGFGPGVVAAAAMEADCTGPGTGTGADTRH